MNYSIKDIARVIHARASSLQDAVIDHLLLDSRKLHFPHTSLFFALQGPRRDGHQFITELYKKGVRNFVVAAKVKGADYADANFLEVEDTLKALQTLAAYHRQQFSIPVIGITGSNGKTIVKEWLNQLLQDDRRIVRSPKSYNSQIGVPLSIWQMNEQHELAIIEAGISTTGEMDHLEQIIRPGIGVLTTIGDAHNEGFQNQEEKLLEKIKLFKRAEWVVCHSKYDPQQQLKKHTDSTVIYCGEKPGDDIRVLSVKKETAITTISVRIQGQTVNKGQSISFRIPFTDDASIENALICLAVLQLLYHGPALTMPGVIDRFERLEPVAMRMELEKGINNCYIINDSYSNDISSLGIALDYLRQQAGSAPATVILSDILQSGIKGAELYKQVAKELKQRNIKRLIGIGEQMSAHYVILKEAVPESAFYLSTDHFLAEVTSHQFREDYILLKGARAFAFERISKWLEQKVHQTLLEINLNALAHNLRQYQALLSASTKVMAMVKAFGYGSGGAEIAGILQYHKVDYLGVAYADEGVDLRKAGINLPVMVMNPEENSFDAIIE
ncbi:MAG TPA: Mur ligase family protein, partial [Chitinophagaceae bacterium]|nr:Mur ligase family protein [Chitinophagaceae bacterium]